MPLKNTFQHDFKNVNQKIKIIFNVNNTIGCFNVKTSIEVNKLQKIYNY